MTYVIDTPTKIGLFQCKCQLKALELEMAGLRHSRGSVYAAIKIQHNLKGSKKKVHAQLSALIAAKEKDILQ